MRRMPTAKRGRAKRQTGTSSRPEYVPVFARLPRGVILLEVILALALFAITAGVVVTAMSASIDAAVTMRREDRSANLAASVVACVRAGLIEPVDAGPVPFSEEPFGRDLPDWTWQITAADVPDAPQGAPIRDIRVTVHDARTGRSRTVGFWQAYAAEPAPPESLP